MDMPTANWASGQPLSDATRKYFFLTARLILLCLLLPSCGMFRSAEMRHGRQIERLVRRSAVFSSSISGFSLLDPENGKTVSSLLADRRFIPASNTKIMTLAACLELLGDSIPGMQLIETEDNLIFRGTADPTFLHPKFQSWQACRDTLLTTRFDSLKLCYYPRKFSTTRFGPGWAWDDYNDDYQAERSEMPVYGNCVQITISPEKADIQPPLFKNNLYTGQFGEAEGVRRLEYDNRWFVTFGKKNMKVDNPIYRPQVDLLLSDTLKREVEDISYTEHPYQLLYPVRTLYSTPLDTVLRRMMYQSDNFIAEQMLLVCAGVKMNLLQQDTLIRYLLDSLWTDLPQRPRWVDGSGLSRYDLNTPANFCHILLRLWNERDHEELLRYFPAGGINGTLESWYAGADGKPYVFAKSGSMSGVYCLSGYVRCKSGKYLIFSMMHNNFIGGNKPWKEETQRVLEAVRGRF